MAESLMGFEGKLYWGAAGGTASTLLTIVRDVSYKIDTTDADTSSRTSILKKNRAAQVSLSIEFETNNDSTNAFVAAARTAAIAGDPIALRTRDKASGWGVDGDFIISIDESQQLTDAQRLKYSAMLTDENREPVFGS